VSTAALYDRDFYRWCLDQARALRALSAMRANLAVPLDLDNLAEEIESLGKSQERELFSRYVVILVHLLKWRFQPERRTRSWRSTLLVQRDELESLYRFSPGLKALRRATLEEAYPIARNRAARETRLPLATFPETCPFTLEEIEDPEFLP
jgi:hypothetical protein